MPGAGLPNSLSCVLLLPPLCHETHDESGDADHHSTGGYDDEQVAHLPGFLPQRCQRLVQTSLKLLRRLFPGSVEGCLVVLLLFFPCSGKGLTDGVTGQFRQAVVFGDVLGEQFVLTDNPGDELLVDLVLFLPETDALRYGGRFPIFELGWVSLLAKGDSDLLHNGLVIAESVPIFLCCPSPDDQCTAISCYRGGVIVVYTKDERTGGILLTGYQNSLVSDDQHPCFKVETRNGYSRFVLSEYAVYEGHRLLVQVLVATDDNFGLRQSHSHSSPIDDCTGRLLGSRRTETLHFLSQFSARPPCN